MKEQGIVSYLKDAQGYGFIDIPGREKSVFFHARDCRGVNFSKIRKGDTVEVERIVATDKGFNAGAVYLIS